MIVYHASNCVVRLPMLVESNRMLDFGQGFYTTTNIEQAKRFAKSVVAKRGGKALVNSYEFEESAAFRKLLTLKFETPSADWLDFVVANRSGTYVGEIYDLVTGPVANDNVYTTIGLYQKGFMSKEATINELRVRTLYNQIVFCRPASFAYLKYLGTEEIV